MTVRQIRGTDAANAILAMLRRREADALARLSAIPESADEGSLLSAAAGYAEAKKAAEAAVAMLSGQAQSQAA